MNKKRAVGETGSPAPVRPSARPIALPDGEPAVLCIHGYKGYPGEYRYLAGRLNAAGFAVYAPRLPGHGTNRSDFIGTTGEMWLEHCIETYKEVKTRHRRVFVTGISLGGVLALLLAAQIPTEKLALLAPAIINTDRKIVFAPIVKHIVPKMKSSYRETSTDPERLYFYEEYWRYKYTAQVAEVFKLQRRARRALPSITGEVFTVVSTADRVVPAKAAAMLESKMVSAGFEHTVLHESSHELLTGVEKERIADELIRRFSR